MNRLFVTSTRAPSWRADDFEVVHCQLLVPECIAEIAIPEADIAVFFSPNAVDCVGNHPSGLPQEIWAVGQVTADAIQRVLGVEARQPARQDFAGLVAALSHRQGAIAAFELEDGPRSLAEALPDHDVYPIPTYRTRIQADSRLATATQRDGIVLASPRAVLGAQESVAPRSLADLESDGVVFGVIGATTGEAARNSGIIAATNVDLPRIDDLCESVAETIRSRSDH